MNPPIPTSPRSWSASERVIVLRPERPRSLRVWWLALHGLVASSILWLGWPPLAAAGALLLLLGHALRRWPQRAPLLRREADGLWSVPERGVTGLTLGPRTRYTTLWVRLALIGPERALYILLLVDQLDPESWRRLQVVLRRGPGRSRGRLGPDRPELR